MIGYKLGHYKSNTGHLRNAIIKIKLLEKSKVIDERQHEIYDHLKTNLAQILSIENSEGEKIESAYLIKNPELKHEIKEGEIIRFMHAKFSENQPDISYLRFYSTKTGALNYSKEIPAQLTGVRYHYYKNGRIKEKHYYVNGFKTYTFGYYDNDFNSLHYNWTYNQKDSNIREYIYNKNENPIAQYVINKFDIIDKVIYDKGHPNGSIYLQTFKTKNIEKEKKK